MILLAAVVATTGIILALRLVSPVPSDAAGSSSDPERDQDAPPLGLALRTGVERMDSLLLRLQLTDSPSDRDAFLRESRLWATRIADARADSSLVAERRDRLRDVGLALETYLASATAWAARDRPSLRRDTAAQLTSEIDAASAPLRAACDTLVEAERSWASTRLARLEAARTEGSRRLRWAVILLIATGTAAAILAWMAVVSPLRAALHERQLDRRRNERLSRLGAVAAGVVHEIRNPLTAIRAHTHRLRQSTPTHDSDFAVIDGEIQRLDRLLEDFLQFARPAEPRRERIEAADLLRAIQELVTRPFAERGIEVRLEVIRGLSLDADPAQIRQVVLNLVRNAADSMPAGGRLTLGARAGMDSRSKPASPVVMLEVADTGTGIPPEVEARLFEPFVSSKPRGTGLGLSIAARLVEAHGGHLQYQTRPGRGTTFTLVLPRARPTSGSSTGVAS